MKSDSDFNLFKEYQDFYERLSDKLIQNKTNLIKRINDKILNMKETNFLFIFDNCEDSIDLNEYLVNMPKNAKVLITTNKQINWENTGFNDKLHVITIEPFDNKETKEFITNSIGQNINQNEIETLNDLIFEYFKTGVRPYVLNKLIGIINLEIDNITLNSLSLPGNLTVSGTTTLSGSVYVEDLIEKRLVVAGAGGLLTNYSGLTFDNGNLNVSGAIEVTNIQGTGSLYLKPDLDDPRLFEIYNSISPSGYTDIHFVGNADLNFFGDDINYLKIDQSLIIIL
jgi:hypothetical protein